VRLEVVELNGIEPSASSMPFLTEVYHRTYPAYSADVREHRAHKSHRVPRRKGPEEDHRRGGTTAHYPQHRI
jgi:hypothetical protein